TRHAHHEVAIGKPAVRHRQQDVVAAWLQIERNLRILRILAPACGQEPWGLAAYDLPVDHSAAIKLLPVFLRWRFLVWRQLGMIESQRRPSAGAQIHVARGKPFSALLRLGDIGPDAFDWTRQQALEANGMSIDDFATRVQRAHEPFLFALGSSCFRTCSSASSRAVQKRRMRLSHLSISSKPD